MRTFEDRPENGFSCLENRAVDSCEKYLKSIPSGKKIRIARSGLGMSIIDLANKTGISESYLSLIERGLREPSKETYKNLIRIVGTPQWYYEIIRSLEGNKNRNNILKSLHKVLNLEDK